jgi:tyrosine-specific transport protein
MKRPVFEAIATLVGITVGAGIMGIPYVISKSGLLIGMLNILIIGFLTLFVNLFLAETVLRTEGNHQLTGYAAKYLGNAGKGLMAFSMVIGIYGALLAYLIGGGSALGSIFGGDIFWYGILFFALASSIIFKGLDFVRSTELISVSVLLVLALFIIAVNFMNINPGNFSIGDGDIFLPYGVILFAFIGTSAIPEMRQELANNYKEMKKAVIVGTLIPIAVYLLFGLSVVLVSGAGTTEVASIGLGKALGPGMVLLTGLFAIFNMATSFIILGLALKEMYHYDLNFSNTKSFLLALGIPLAIFVVGFRDFISPLSIAGSLTGGINGILIVLILWKAREKSDRKPEFTVGYIYPLSILIVLMFLLGIAHEILSLLGMM